MENLNFSLSAMTDTQELIMLLETFLQDNYSIRRNVVSDMLEYRKLKDNTSQDYKPLSKEAFNSIVISAMKDGIEGNIRQLLEQLINSDAVPEYHPAKDYLCNLQEWDGKDRIEPLFKRIPGITAEQIYFASRWLRSCVAHWLGLDKTYGNQTVLMLIGKQGEGKSTFFKQLLPKHLRPYFLDHLNLSNKFDKEMALSNNLLVNIDEIDQVKSGQQANLKYTITKGSVNGRKIFGHVQRERDRVASFTATTNNPHPLKDPTGSRRYLCIKVAEGQTIDNTDNIDYDQLFAQLCHEITVDKLDYWFSESENRRIQQINQRFNDSTDLEQIIINCFRKPSEEEPSTSLTSSQILEIISQEYPGIPNNRSTQTRIGATLTNLGFERRHSKNGNVYSIINLVA